MSRTKNKKPVNKNKPSRVKRIVKWIVLSLIILLTLTIIQVVSLNFYNPETTAFMLYRAYQAKAQKKPYHKTITWRDSKKISAALRCSIVAAEDGEFFNHYGFDFKGMQKAFQRNTKANRIKYGGSTITQQLAKNLFLWPQRSYVRKALEAYYTVLMELLLSKRRILEIYCNVIEWGPGIYGAEAAARYHFHISAVALSEEQAATLAALIPRPLKYRPTSNYVQHRQQDIQQYSRDVDLNHN